MKKFVSLMMAGFMSLGLVACGGGGDDDDDGVSYDSAGNASVTISFHGWGEAEEKANYQTLVNQFMQENPDVTVVYTAESASTYMTSLTNRSNNLPDMFYMPDEDFLYWASAGLLKDISSYVTETELNDLWETAVDEYYFNMNDTTLGKSNGAGLYGLPKDLGPYTLVYNKTLLNQLISQNGLNSTDVYAKLSATDPMTWTEFRDLLKSIDTNTKDNIYGVTHYDIDAAVYSNNADFFTEGAETSRITEKNFTDALQFIADLHLVDGVMPSAADQNSTNGYTRFKSGSAVFTFMGPWDCTSFWSTVNFDYDILPVPVGTASGAQSTAWVGSMAYSLKEGLNSAKTEACMRLAKYLCFDEDAQRKFYGLGQQVPNIVEMAVNEYVNDTMNVLKNNTVTVNAEPTQMDTSNKPTSRGVWVNTINGTGGADVVGGKTRPCYYTYSSDWYNQFSEYINTQGLWTGTKTAAQICADYNSTFQLALNEMRGNLGF